MAIKDLLTTAIIARLTQPSTIKGLIQLGGSLGMWSLNPSTEAAIVAFVMGLLGLINVLIDEHKAAKQTAARVASDVAVNVAANVAQDTALTAIEQNTPWLAGIPPQEAIQRPDPNHKEKV